MARQGSDNDVCQLIVNSLAYFVNIAPFSSYTSVADIAETMTSGNITALSHFLCAKYTQVKKYGKIILDLLIALINRNYSSFSCNKNETHRVVT